MSNPCPKHGPRGTRSGCPECMPWLRHPSTVLAIRAEAVSNRLWTVNSQSDAVQWMADADRLLREFIRRERGTL